jgi:hypothetical protein
VEAFGQIGTKNRTCVASAAVVAVWIKMAARAVIRISVIGALVLAPPSHNV